MPIKKNRVVQTGPKTHDGGLIAGLVIVAYHVGISEKVKKEPTIPANSQIAIDTMSARKLENFLLFEISFSILKYYQF